MSSRRYSEGHWRAWFEEFDHSGLSVERFCRAKGTTANTFYLWRKRLGLESVRKTRSKATSIRPELASFSFVSATPVASKSPVEPDAELGSEPDEERQIEIELPGEIRIRVHNDSQSLRPIVQVLLEWKAQS